MLNESLLQSLVLTWMVAGGLLLLVQWKFGRGSGLVAAYLLELIVLHWLAAAIYLLPWYYLLDPELVVDGLEVSTYGFVGFATGVLVATAWGYIRYPNLTRKPEHAVFAEPERLKKYLLIGAVSYAVLAPLLTNVATVSAIVNAASGFVVIALALVCWNAAHDGSRFRFWGWLLLVSALPFITISVQGFMGYGLAAAAVVFAFVGSFYRVSWRTALAAMLAGYMGLSLYVTYMRDRDDIRDVVWGGSSAMVRVQQVASTFTEFEFFDINDIDHLRRIDIRLNQNVLIGAAVQQLRVNPEKFANGRTLTDALIALVPRVLWPDKPMMAGSGNIVSEFTGMRFAEGTSVGVGQVMELYINFGLTGVFIGLAVFGFILASIDRNAAVARNEGRWSSFALWFLPGVAMLQVGGSLVEVTTSAAAAFLVAVIVQRITDRPQRTTIRRGQRRRHVDAELFEPQG